MRASLALALLGCLMASHVATAQKKVYLGCMFSYTPTALSTSQAAEAGLRLALADAKVKDVELLPCEKSLCTAAGAQAGFKKLAGKKPPVVFGDQCSDATLGALPLANTGKVILFSPMSTSPRLSIAGDYFLRTVPSDTNQGKVMADIVYKAGGRNAATFYGSYEAYGVGLAQNFETGFKGLKGKVGATYAFTAAKTPAGLTDFVNKIKTAKVDSVFMATNEVSYAAALIKALAAAKLKVKLYGGDSLAVTSLSKEAGNALTKGMVVTASNQGTKAFQTKFKAANKSVAFAPPAASAYDAMSSFLKVWAASKDKSPAAIKKALETSKYPGVTGTVEFDQYGDRKATATSYAILTFDDKGNPV